MEENTETIFVRITPKLKAKWLKALNSGTRYSEAIVIRKYVEMVAREGRVRTEEWL